LAVIGRTFIQHRDLLDLHLFASHAAADARHRMQGKLARLGVDPAAIVRRLEDLKQSGDRHARAIEAIIRNQLDAAAAAVLMECGGGRTVLENTRSLLVTLLEPEGEPA
jgi:hypothetical protein